MNINFKPVTENNRQEILGLKLAHGQEGFIESVSQCLFEADHNKRWKPLGIYDGEQLVGFAMYGFFRREYFPFGRLWLDRLLIDMDFQGRGYGKAALNGLIMLLKSEYPKKDIYLSVVKGNDAAAKLYQEFGFYFNGKKDVHGEDIMVKKR